MKAINLWTGEKLFARKDYEGLTEESAQKLREFRTRLANEARQHKNGMKGWKFYEENPIYAQANMEEKLRVNKFQSNVLRKELLRSQAENPTVVKAAEKTGLGRKLAIGGTVAAGVAGLGYGGYRLLKKKKKD